MRILIKSRIHITLLSMHGSGCRINGGLGFSLNKPNCVLSFTQSDEFYILDNRAYPLSKNEKYKLINLLEIITSSLNLKIKIMIILEGEMRTHYGMGSGTSIRLACIEALININGKSVSQEMIIRLSKRGGTSGIGIQTYFSGQFVFDLGVKNLDQPLLPSSIERGFDQPLLISAINFPNWAVGVCLPNKIKTKTQQEEVDFFRGACPINKNESYEVLYHSLMGTLSSIRENDKDAFIESIKRIQLCEWKKLERESLGSELFMYENILYELGAECVGMSSLGPLLYFIAPEAKYDDIKIEMLKFDCEVLITSASNSGRELYE